MPENSEKSGNNRKTPDWRLIKRFYARFNLPNREKQQDRRLPVSGTFMVIPQGEELLVYLTTFINIRMEIDFRSLD
jgi:hypothetical protein